MTLYEIGLVVWGVTGLDLPIIYKNYYRPKFVDKHSDYFKVVKLERKILTYKRYFLIYCAWFLIGLNYENIYKLYTGGMQGKKYLLAAVVLVVWIIFMIWCWKEHVSLPLKKYLDADEMIKSIESERFYQIGNNMWYSENWVRISYKFYPKNLIADIGVDVGGRGNTAIYARTVWGTEYRNDGFFHHRGPFYSNLKQLTDMLPISDKIGKNRAYIGRYFRQKDVQKRWAEYVQTRSVAELMEGDELLSLIVEDIKKNT